MRICQVTRIFLGLLSLIWAIDARGHGRVQSSVAAKVWEDRAVVTINAALVDLMIVGNLDYQQVARLSSEERLALLQPHLQSMSERFRLIDENDRELVPDSVTFRIPDYSGGAILLSPGVDQKQMAILMEYALPSPPTRMLFWQSFGEGLISDMYPEEQHHIHYDHGNVPVDATVSIPIYTSFTVRQKGELVLLPSELGPGFPVLYFFSWDSDPVPLAHRSSLQSAGTNWERRPASARLTVGESEVTWRAYITLQALEKAFKNGFPEPKEDGWEGLRNYLSEQIILVINGEAVNTKTVSLRVYPMSTMGLMHQRKLPYGTKRPGLVVLEVSSTVTQLPHSIVAGWKFYTDSIDRLYSEIIDSGEVAELRVLSPDNPTLEYQQ